MIYGKPFKIQASPICSFISLQIKPLAVFARESRIFGEKKNEKSFCYPKVLAHIALSKV